MRPNRYFDLLDNSQGHVGFYRGGCTAVLLIVAIRLAMEPVKHAGDCICATDRQRQGKVIPGVTSILSRYVFGEGSVSLCAKVSVAQPRKGSVNSIGGAPYNSSYQMLRFLGSEYSRQSSRSSLGSCTSCS